MTASLSDEQQREIAREGNGPIRVVHPTTQKEYVLMAADLFDRVKSTTTNSAPVKHTLPKAQLPELLVGTIQRWTSMTTMMLTGLDHDCTTR